MVNVNVTQTITGQIVLNKPKTVLIIAQIMGTVNKVLVFAQKNMKETIVAS